MQQRIKLIKKLNRLTQNKILLIIFSLFFYSCANLKAGIYLLTIDKLNGNEIKKNELYVREYLEGVLITPEEYDIEAYKRTGLSFQLKKTKLLEHSFFVITDQNSAYHTLSFYGTDFTFYSEGAWVLDSDSDLGSYNMYLVNNNKWDVAKIKTKSNIDVKETIINIIEKLDSNITFYYRDHIRKKPNMNNCNTMLYETLVEKR
jgi:hypothetical protein